MNRPLKIVLTAAVAVACLMASGAASAHWHGTVWIGVGPVWGAPYYPYYYPPAYYPPVVAQPYVQSSPVVQMPAPQTFWYYCRQSDGFYPYVSNCPSGWEEVPAQPAAPTPGPAPAPH